jgi:hypothetical protein
MGQSRMGSRDTGSTGGQKNQMQNKQSKNYNTLKNKKMSNTVPPKKLAVNPGASEG